MGVLPPGKHLESVYIPSGVSSLRTLVVQGLADKNEYSETRSSHFYLNEYALKPNQTDYNKSWAMAPPKSETCMLGGPT